MVFLPFLRLESRPMEVHHRPVLVLVLVLVGVGSLLSVGLIPKIEVN